MKAEKARIDVSFFMTPPFYVFLLSKMDYINFSGVNLKSNTASNSCRIHYLIRIVSIKSFMNSLHGENCSVNVIIDEEQKVKFIKVYDIPQLPDIDEITDFLKK